MYYVYIARIDGEIVYIGKGTGNRFEHVNSGVSHNYFLNKSHFSGVVADIEIYQKFELESDALSLEASLIALHKPKWNNETNPNKRQRNDGRSGRGVQLKNKRVNPWCAYVHKGGKKIHIGYYATEAEAEEARSTYIG